MAAEDYDIVIGLEAHAHLLTETKMFCGCRTTFGAPPNSQTCPVCIGMPGVLPVINRKALMLALRAAAAFRCGIPKRMRFDRKNYYYPDLPKNYQISQNYEPIGRDGYVEIETPSGRKKIGLDNIHIEEDAGKLVHPEGSGADYSEVDLNRAGTPLLEIVTKPDMSGVEEVESYMETLRRTLEALDISDCKMQEGSLRFEASISLKPKGASELGKRVEIKNLNSVRAVLNALSYEAKRQAAALDRSEALTQETRLWNETSGRTERMRSKEEAQDYRYFPEPDLGPVVILDEWLEETKRTIAELPNERKWRFEEQYGLPPYDSGVLTHRRAVADYFEAAVAAGGALVGDERKLAKQVSNWVMGPVLSHLNERGVEIEKFNVRPECLAEMIGLIEKGVISNNIAQQLLPIMVETGRPPEELAREKGMVQISDSSAVEAFVAKVLEANPKQVEEYKGGKKAVFGFLMGQIMREAKGKANPRLAREALTRALEG
ncbi:MAG: Asp-tRNA(Asn)/Glu-tRNA(Gln) amidotransferase subunit GatB [Planctomycetota bacterium]|jgi:aspartyl-tRNA(Asn)/glutamyl-tRNA(Gln) amidotransferase subunit B